MDDITEDSGGDSLPASEPAKAEEEPHNEEHITVAKQRLKLLRETENYSIDPNSRLLNLPREVRDLVWSFCIVDKDEYGDWLQQTLYYPIEYFRSVVGRYDLSFFRVCKQVSALHDFSRIYKRC